MYKLNVEWIKNEAKKLESVYDIETNEFINFILEYRHPLPIELYWVFNQYHNLAGMPRAVCQKVQKIHGANWVQHERVHAFNKPGETFQDCNNRLVEDLMDKTELPIYIKK